MTDTETLTPEEYDTLVELTAKARRLAEARLAAYVKATGGFKPRYGSDPTFTFKSRAEDRTGRDPLGRYDIAVTYRDFDGDETDVYLPSAILWDPKGITAAIVDVEKAKQAAYEREQAERRERAIAEAKRTEVARAKAVLRKHGFKAVPK